MTTKAHLDPDSLLLTPRPHRRTFSEQLLGTVGRRYWATRGVKVGNQTLIPLSTHIVSPGKVILGEHVVLQRNSTLDGTSSRGHGLEIGSGCRLKENVWCAAYGGFIEVGSNVLIGRNSVIHGHGGVTIGDWTMMGPGVMILSSEHGHDLTVDRVPFQLQREEYAPVDIRENVWIGAGVTVLPGVTINRDVVIGAGAVVVRDLASGGVYVGIPAVRVGDIPTPSA